MDVWFQRLFPPGLAGRAVESRWEIRLRWDHDIDAFAKRVCKRAFFVDCWIDEGGVGFRVSFSYWVKVIIAPRIIRVVV